MRFLLMLAGLFVAFLIARHLWAPPRRRREETGRMVRCDYCGLHVPEEEAVARGGRHYCSPEHERLAARLEHDRH